MGECGVCELANFFFHYDSLLLNCWVLRDLLIKQELMIILFSENCKFFLIYFKMEQMLLITSLCLFVKLFPNMWRTLSIDIIFFCKNLLQVCDFYDFQCFLLQRRPKKKGWFALLFSLLIKSAVGSHVDCSQG